MRIHKNTFIGSIIIAFIALVSYSIFGYAHCLTNRWLENISLAIFGSAILVVITSLIGYHTEKRRSQQAIINSSCSLSLSDYIMEEGLQLSTHALARLTNIAYNNLKLTHSELKEYYQGSFFKDKNLKALINEEIIPYAQKIEDFRVAVAKIIGIPDNNITNIEEKFNELWNTEQTIGKHIDNWMVERGFLLGKEFHFEEK